MSEGRNEASPHTRQASGSGGPRAVRVIIADSQAIYRVGLRKILAVEDDIRVVAQAENLLQLVAAVKKNPADVLIFESQLCPNAAEAATELLQIAPSLKIILLTSDPDERETMEYLRCGVRGIVNHAVSPDLLVKCMRKVTDGETWLDKRAINWVIEAYRSQASTVMEAPRTKWRLSEKEMLIISSVAQGMRNKEIAVQVGTTEQVIKNYLRKIYDKLGVSDRLELALYCIHHRLLERPEQPASLAQGQSAYADGEKVIAGR